MNQLSKQLIKISRNIQASKKLFKITNKDYNWLQSTLFSCTPYYNLEKIKESGLWIKTDYMNNKVGFFFATDYDNALMYGNEYGAKRILFTIDKSLLSSNKIYYDSNDCYTDAYVWLLTGHTEYNMVGAIQEDIIYGIQNGEIDMEKYMQDYKVKNCHNLCFFYYGIIPFEKLTYERC